MLVFDVFGQGCFPTETGIRHRPWHLVPFLTTGDVTDVRALASMDPSVARE